MKRNLSLWLITAALSFTAACGPVPAETAAPKPTEPVRATATVPVQPTPAPKLQLGKLAFVKGGDVWVKELPDGEARRLTLDGPAYRDERPLWSRDGAFILFGRMVDDRMELWLMRSDGSDLKQVVDEMGPLPDPPSGWFGYYGYLYWDRMYDWWPGDPGARVFVSYSVLPAFP